MPSSSSKAFITTEKSYPDKPWYCAVQGTQVVGVAIAAGTLSSIIVFLPMVFGEKDDISIFLTQVAITMAIAHLASWLVAVSLVPMLSARLPPPKFIGRKNIITRVQGVYERFIGWTLSHRRWTMFGLLVLLVISIVLPAAHTKMDMFPQGERDRLFIGYRLNALYPLKELQGVGRQGRGLSRAHRDEFHIKNIYSRYAEDGNDTFTSMLFDKNDKTRPSTKVVLEKLRKELPKVPIGEIVFDFNSNGNGNDNSINLSLVGDSGQVLRDLSATVISVLETVAVAARRERESGQRQSRTVGARGSRQGERIRILRERRRAVHRDRVARHAAEGFPRQDSQLPVWLRFRGSDAQSLDNLSDYKLRRPDGTPDSAACRWSASTRATPRP